MTNTIYALVDSNNSILRKQYFDAVPADPIGKGWRWLPFVEQPDPEYDPNFEYFTTTETVNVNEVVETKTVFYKEKTAVKLFVVEKIKNYAQKLISEMFVVGDSYSLQDVLIKEINFIARASELINKKTDGLEITEEEQFEIDNFKMTWDVIKQIRGISDQKETEISSMSVEELKNYDVTANWI
jgi:hypothetical protein